jgi:tetratricopeptide (TPR) repeat protein
MKNEEIIKSSKVWAKKNRHTIKAKILKTAPEWVKSEHPDPSAGVRVTITAFGPEYFQAGPCEIWLSQNGNKNYFEGRFGALALDDFSDANDVGETLSEAVKWHLEWSVYEVISAWSKSKNYELDEDNSSVEINGEDCTAYEYGHKKDPAVKECIYPSSIGYSSKGDLVVERKIAESRRLIAPQGVLAELINPRTGAWFAKIASTKKTTATEIREWLDENAKTGLYADILVTYLDKKTATRIIRENSVNWGDIHLYELKAATDEAIEVLCKYDGKLTLSEKSFLSLTDAQIQRLIENTNVYYEEYTTRNLVVEIGVFLQGEIPEDLCRKIAKHPISKHGGGHYYFNHHAAHISKKCAAILAKSSSEIRYADSSVKDIVENHGSELIGEIKNQRNKIPDGDYSSLLKHHKSAYATLKKLFGEYHKNTLEQLTLICDIQIDLGKLDDALATQKKYVDGRFFIAGPCPFSVSPERRYALILCDLGRYAEAVPIFQRLWKDYLRKGKVLSLLDEKNTGVSRLYILDLCDALVGNQQYGEALKIINRAVKVSSEVNGAENLETLNLLENKAVILIEQGKYSQAATILKGLYAAFQKNLGEYHESTIHIKDRYATTLHFLSNATKSLPNRASREAEVLYTELLTYYTKKGKAQREDATRIADNLKNLTKC